MGKSPLGIAFVLLLTLAPVCRAQGVITTVAGTGSIGFSGDGGPATSATLGIPQAVVVDAAGNLYIADTLNQRVRRVDGSGVITTIAGSGSPLLSGDGGPATSAGIFFVGTATHQGLAVDRDGDLYLTDSGNGRIRKVSASGIITTVAGSSPFTFSGDGGPATSAGLNSPVGVAVDSAGNIYIADRTNARIRKVDTSGTITTVAGNGQFLFSGDGGPATSAGIGQVFDVAVDGAGNLFIADGTGRVRKVTAAGTISTVAGGGTNTFCNFRGSAVTAGLAARDIEVDAAGNLYIGDSGGCIRKVDTSGAISTIAGGGLNNPGDGGPATSAALGSVAGIAVDASGNIYIADSSAGRIRKVTAEAPTATPPSIAAGGILNAASFARGAGTGEISPGSIVSIFGSGFSTGVITASTVPLPTSLGGTRVLMNGIEAPLFAVTPSQINAQVPWQLRSPTVQTINVQVAAGGTLSPGVIAPLGDRPGIFSVLQSGAGPGIITHADGNLVTAANPATNGETLVIYCTALGAVNNTPAAGSPSPSSPLAVAAVTPAATIGNMPARVTFAGLVPGFIGLSQVNVEVPASARPVPGDPEGSVVRVLISSGALQSNSVLLYMR